MVVPEDGGGAVGCFRPCESHGGKDPAKAGVSKPSLFGSGLIESFGVSLRVRMNRVVHIESRLHVFRRAFNWLHCSPEDLKASGKQDVLSIYTGAIFFTTEVEGYLRFVERETTG